MSTVPGLVYAQPHTPPVPPPVDPGRFGVDLWIVPEDPSLPSWQLSDGEGNGIVLMRGVRGLGKPEHTFFDEPYATRDGAYHYGERTEMREVFLPVYLFHDGDSHEWVERDRIFRQVFRRGKYSRLYCRQPNGEIRSLRVRYRTGMGEATDLDSTFFGWAKYGIYLDAPQPFWEGEEVIGEWGIHEGLPMYGPDNLALPINLSYPNVDSATMKNPGDMPASPIVTLFGTEDGMDAGAEVTINGDTIAVPFALDPDDVLTIDHSPEEQSAILNGTTDVTESLGSYDFATVEPGQSVPIGIDIPGDSGKVRVTLRALYEEAL